MMVQSAVSSPAGKIASTDGGSVMVVIASSRMLVKHFFPAPAWKVVGGF